MEIKHFFDSATGTFTYLLIDEASGETAIIDPLLDFNLSSGVVSTESADTLIAFIKARSLTVKFILETHVHADHITASYYLQKKLGGKTGISAGIKSVLKHWVPLFDGLDVPMDGSHFDLLLEDNDILTLGDTHITVWHTPGHTPACVSYISEHAAFTGDTIFAPTLGTARCDFPGGSADLLFASIQKLYELPHNHLLYIGHDYPKPNAFPQMATTVALQKAQNKMLNNDTTQAAFISAREARDATLAVPKLLYPALQANLNLGQFIKDTHNRPIIIVPLTV